MYLLIAGVVLAAAASLFFSTLTFALRDFSRARLADRMAAFGSSRWLEPTIECQNDLAFVTAVGRLLANLMVLLLLIVILRNSGSAWVQYGGSFIITGAICFFSSVAIPHALAMHGAETAIALFAGFIHGQRLLMLPVAKLMHGVDHIVERLVGQTADAAADEIEQDIVSVVEEGVKEGVVDEQEREMIESVIEFRDTHVGQIMTTRPEIVAIEVTASLDDVKQTIEESGHSRIPVFDGSLDRVVGMLYARDLLKSVGRPANGLDIRGIMRPAIFVPETKPLRDLLREFRAQKVHIAIVLDEYGGAAGLVTIEDILEELVGEIADEHEPAEPPMLKRIDAATWEVNARLDIEQANREIGLNLPTDAGYDTVGGFVSITLGRIPTKGTTFIHETARFTIVDALPQRVKSLKIEMLQPAGAKQ